MRIPYSPNPPQPQTPEEEAIVARVQARRHPRPLQPLDLALLHSPPVADGWNSFLGAVRTQTTIPADLRELAISRVAVINTAWYEWAHHAPLAVGAGVAQEAMDWLALQAGDLAEAAVAEEGRRRFNEKQWAVLLISDEMTRKVRVSDETFADVKKHFSEREVVEIVTTVACYNCVSRFLVALDVGERNSLTPEDAIAH
ncbi:4-carboxymuconolactone decarboxylase family protein [Plectosphaerella plurivora]|uniref:4-carboxymuconolactone decarboxylase family protein n=1 Tax=Plectosphaerella plurivora TaxID=936078 RepID=A0A9P8V2B5_9PEZI|nr:4-carboxymuconolactone decarboxylase family protein [Plectosphaerella plurivora]